MDNNYLIIKLYIFLKYLYKYLKYFYPFKILVNFLNKQINIFYLKIYLDYSKIYDEDNNQIGIDDPYIYIKKNNLSKKYCNEIINYFDNEPNKLEGITLLNTPNKDIKNTMDFHISSNTKDPKWKKIDDVLYKILNQNIKDYIQYIDRKTEIIHKIHIGNDTGYQIQRYIKNEGFYIWHEDSNSDKNGNRILTFMWYLNDVEEGGETSFTSCKIKPEAGKFVMFPATWSYMHKANKPISSNKYIITGWLFR